jgi:hypothetical protein
MATASYISGRKKYGRPQAMLWADNSGTTTDSGLYVPLGHEIGADVSGEPDTSLHNQFLILSDHNRLPLDMSIERIENKQRMINGRMRSHHIADKLTLSTSWEMLPSRSYSSFPDFNEVTGKSPSYKIRNEEFTADGGAGGNELLSWYENHSGSFWLYLAYDKYPNFDTDTYNRLGQYNEVIEVFFADFKYSVATRGTNNHDLWDISVILEEV